MSTPSPYCGRLDEHAEHWWTRPHARAYGEAVTGHHCPGMPVVEGGAEVNEKDGG